VKKKKRERKEKTKVPTGSHPGLRCLVERSEKGKKKGKGGRNDYFVGEKGKKEEGERHCSSCSRLLSS